MALMRTAPSAPAGTSTNQTLALRAFINFGGAGTSADSGQKDGGFHDVRRIECATTTNWVEVTRGENIKTQFSGLETVLELKETHPILFVASLKKSSFDKVIAKVLDQSGKAKWLMQMENCRIQSYNFTGEGDGSLCQTVVWVADKIIVKHEEPNKEAEYQFSKPAPPGKNEWA